MDTSISILATTAASIGFLHTITGPDHYLPFIALGKARRWPLGRALAITALCGVGHVLGSVVLGLLGISLGLAVGRIEIIEGVRGNLAAWMLIALGLVYMAWGLRRAWKNKVHTHAHVHADGTVHTHSHTHHHDHGHLHTERGTVTPWVLFIIFVLGPCEPLIPILMYPAARHDTTGLILVTLIFSAVTISTMVAMVWLADRGFRLLPAARMERYTHALAGFAICASGLAIQFLGL